MSAAVPVGIFLASLAGVLAAQWVLKHWRARLRGWDTRPLASAAPPPPPPPKREERSAPRPPASPDALDMAYYALRRVEYEQAMLRAEVTMNGLSDDDTCPSWPMRTVAEQREFLRDAEERTRKDFIAQMDSGIRARA